MKIKVVGAGWYGCHLASVLRHKHDVSLVDKAGIFAGASGANQSRLHQGWHYPRCSVTRRCSQKYRKVFLALYGFLTIKIYQCIYAVADESLLDWASYMGSMLQTDPGEHDVILNDEPTAAPALIYGGRTSDQDEGRECELNDGPFRVTNLQGAVSVDENIVLEDRAKEYFEQTLGDIFSVEEIFAAGGWGLPRLSSPDYDVVIDCTYAAFHDRGVECYEPCVLWRLQGDSRVGFTVMDGDFGSIMPSYMGGGEVTLTGPEHTPIARVETYAKAVEVENKFRGSVEWQDHNREKQYAVMRHFIPDMDTLYPECLGFRMGIRAKPKGPADTRQCEVFRGDGNVIHVRPGKIDAIFIAEEKVVRELEGR